MGKKLDLEIEELEERIAPLPAVQALGGEGFLSGELNIREGDGSFSFSLVDTDSKEGSLFAKVENESPLSIKITLEGAFNKATPILR